jgi:hypothetical protein
MRNLKVWAVVIAGLMLSCGGKSGEQDGVGELPDAGLVQRPADLIETLSEIARDS